MDQPSSLQSYNFVNRFAHFLPAENLQGQLLLRRYFG